MERTSVAWCFDIPPLRAAFSANGVLEMSKFRFEITMSLDGYIAGPNQSLEQPLGEGGEQLHEWVIRSQAWRERHGLEGGETGLDSDVMREASANIGATIMGRNMFGGGPGPWNTTAPWTGWWGDDPPFHTPVFVLTHYAREPLVMQGATTFFFVTDGIESALEQAMRAAGDKDMALGGGADVAQQYLAAGLIDEMKLHVVPMFLGGGARLFDNLGDSPPHFEPVGAIQGQGVTHLTYRAVRG